MEFALGFLIGFALTLTFQYVIPKLRRRLSPHPALESLEASKVITPRKPQNQYTDYTIEELEQRKRTLEKQYRGNVNWPVLRARDAREIKEILDLLEWHYDQNGTREFLEQKAKNKRELEEFDQQYRAALRGGN